MKKAAFANIMHCKCIAHTFYYSEWKESMLYIIKFALNNITFDTNTSFVCVTENFS